MATYNGNSISTSEGLKSGDIINFDYQGAVRNFTLVKGTYKFEVWGAQGGNYNTSYLGGAGGYSVGTLELSADTTIIYVYAGGQPATVTSSQITVAGGFNGGGNGQTRYYSGTYTYGQGGGGGSDIRIGQDSLYARVIVAGGGGGNGSGSNEATTKYGGGTSGGSAVSGYGASQTSAGTNGSFGTGGSATTSGTNYKYGSGGGGGGWYGGGACSNYSDSTNYRTYNGGGSGFVWTGSNAPSGYLLDSTYYLTDAKTIAGNTSITSPIGSTETGHTGNGYIRITCVKMASGASPYIKVNNTWKEPQSVYIKVNGAWKEGEVFVKINGNWTQ